jgi:flagellar hook-basal body complex protein FliE
MTTPSAVANAYAALSHMTNPATNAAKALGEGEGQNFGSLLKDAIGSVLETGRKSDGQMRNLAAGKANLVDVVTAVSETEVAIDALVSIRDKVIASYEEIMKMPI